MTKIPRFISKQLGRLISAKTLINARTPIFHPFYHVVSNKNLPHVLNYPYRNEHEFETELDFFLKHFKAVSLEDLHSKRNQTEKIFHISFDDGLRECAEIIAPILLKKGIPATFFVNPGFVDNRALFHKYKASLILNELKENPQREAAVKFLKQHDLGTEKLLKTNILQDETLNSAAELLGLNFHGFLEKQKPYLSTQQILELQNQGFSVGAHSFYHPEFWEISEAEQLEEVMKSMDWLNKTIDPPIKTFAFPFTDSGVSRSVLKTIASEKICDITFGTAGLKFDSFNSHFQRYPVEIPGDFMQNLKSEWIYFVLRKWIGKATVNH